MSRSGDVPQGAKNQPEAPFLVIVHEYPFVAGLPGCETLVGFSPALVLSFRTELASSYSSFCIKTIQSSGLQRFPRCTQSEALSLALM